MPRQLTNEEEMRRDELHHKLAAERAHRRMVNHNLEVHQRMAKHSFERIQEIRRELYQLGGEA